MSDIHDVIALIPENTLDEALFAIETIVTFPAANKARLRVFPANEFRIWVALKRDTIQITAESWPSITCNFDHLLGSLRRMIYAIDEAISAGTYAQGEPCSHIILDQPNPPADMDIPIWDAAEQKWRDAEY